jgi:hypothetical protein
MKRIMQQLAMVATVALVVVGGVATSYGADEVKVVGVIDKIEITTGDAPSAMVTLKPVDGGEVVIVKVIDTLTLDKFNDKRIVVGDEVRCKYTVEDGVKLSKLLRKTAGC